MSEERQPPGRRPKSHGTRRVAARPGAGARPGDAARPGLGPRSSVGSRPGLGPRPVQRARPVVVEPEPPEEMPEETTPPGPIRTRGLTKHYGDLVAVDHLDLDVQPGEIFGLLGQNGAGKTTTILMLLGLSEPTSGRAQVVGFNPTRQPLDVKRRVGYLPDAVGFYGGLTGRQNLRYTARLNGLPKDVAEERIDEVLEQVAMTERADTKVDTYSRGMLQRLGIADALVKDPQLLILDEPTTAIDPIGVIEILDLLRSLARDRGMAIMLSSHLLNQVQSVCDRVGIFAAGQLIGVGTVPELARRFGDDSARIEVAFEGLETKGAAERTRGILADLPNVREVVPSDRPSDPWILVADSDAGISVREAVLAAAARETLHLTSIRQVVPSLDDIYREALYEHGLAGDAQASEGRAVA